MKKIVLSIAGVMAIAAFAPEASALPVFARQTGMACSACHFQHFPLLNGFGRSFKAGAFTMVGAQGKVEGENMSIPNTLNMAVLTTMGYTTNNAAKATPAQAALGLQTQGNGNVYVPGTNGEFSMFIGGRTSDFSGALAEIGFLGNTGSPVGSTVGLTSAKFPMLFPVGDARIGIVPFTTDGQGASYGFELLNTGANAIHTMLFAGGDFNGSITPALSAQQYIGTGAAATGAALVANNSMGFINITKYHQVGPNDIGTTGAKLGSTYLRVAGTFDLAGFDSAVGVQSWSGSSLDVTTTAKFATKGTAIDGQMQGELGGMPVGFYASYATAPGSVVGSLNAYNGGTLKRDSFNFSAEVGVIPEVATLGFAIRRAKSGVADVVTGANLKDNAILLAGTYKLRQNMMLQLVYTKQSGSFWTPVQTTAVGSTQTAINLATLF